MKICWNCRSEITQRKHRSIHRKTQRTNNIKIMNPNVNKVAPKLSDSKKGKHETALPRDHQI